MGQLNAHSLVSVSVCLQVIFSTTSLFQMISLKIQYQSLIEYVFLWLISIVLVTKALPLNQIMSFPLNHLFPKKFLNVENISTCRNNFCVFV